MNRARWITGGLVGAGALVVGAEAFATYVAGRLVVGVVAVVVLMGVLAVGLASLARARAYIARELEALRADPPGGALYAGRRQQALELRRRNVAPDLEVLAEATAADEAERGFTGKYLVATTVLVGLVGTFGGLMETLARVSPLLKGDLSGGADGVLGLIAGPLAGLHIAFGTSVVAIMVTLALGLIQGDVTLSHERLLARLQERTRHVLMPELWPDAESAGERTVRALHELRTFVGSTLTTNAEASAAKIAAAVRGEMQRLVEQVGGELRGASAGQTAALERASGAVGENLKQVTAAAAKELADAAKASRETMATAAATIVTTARESDDRAREHLVQAIGATTEHARATQTEIAALVARAAAGLDAVVAALAETTARTSEALAATTATTSEALTATTSRTAEAFVAATSTASESFATTTIEMSAALATAATTTSEAFATATASAVAALAEVRGGVGAHLEGASQALTTAASELRGTVDALSPTLAQLAPQLSALAAEVALLAARADSPEEPNAILDELVRLGEDVERLVALSEPVAAPQESGA
jgi:hypothetical protein